FARTAAAAAINVSVHDQAAADTSGYFYIRHILDISRRAILALATSAHVGVVVEIDRRLAGAFHHRADIEVVPAGHSRWAHQHPRGGVQWARDAQPNANDLMPANMVLGRKVHQTGDDLLQTDFRS